jgi:hypothetical protein
MPRLLSHHFVVTAFLQFSLLTTLFFTALQHCFYSFHFLQHFSLQLCSSFYSLRFLQHFSLQLCSNYYSFHFLQHFSLQLCSSFFTVFTSYNTFGVWPDVLCLHPGPRNPTTCCGNGGSSSWGRGSAGCAGGRAGPTAPGTWAAAWGLPTLQILSKGQSGVDVMITIFCDFCQF